MEYLKDWAFSVCCASLICGIFKMILPEGCFGKTFKVILSVFFICTVISPLMKINLSEIKNDFEISSVEENLDNNVFYENSLEYIESEIYTSAEAFLKNNGIEAKDIEIKINISEDYGIDINKFVLTIAKEDYIDSLEEKIYKEIGIMPEIVFSED